MNKERWRFTIQGNVQGVGFRPFVYSLAIRTGVTGWVQNSPQGVIVEAEGLPLILDTFTAQLTSQLPPNARIDHFDVHPIGLVEDQHFEIHHSELQGAKTALILPDLAICPDCLREIFDPVNRRFRYPFTNCTHCGPRYSIIQALPYDRMNTTMRTFIMCDECRTEYENPLDRRFHAQPNACPHCGPQLILLDNKGILQYHRDDALAAAVAAIRNGQIVALKGLGGFQLLVDARNEDAVQLLRRRKGRYEKPFAVMFPTDEYVKALCLVSQAEAKCLHSTPAPIVLLERTGQEIAASVAPDNPYIGAMLPYTPLHHLLMADLGFPIVATSGNRSGEPILIDNDQALDGLRCIADVFLMHNRPIARHIDDSVLYVFEDRPVMLRRARGYAPAPVQIEGANADFAAVGAQQKNVLAVAHQNHVFLSQHLGDMENIATLDAFTRAFDDFKSLYDLNPTALACDLHPDYTTTRFAEQSNVPLFRVQHHYAHVLSCMAEHHLDAPVLGVAWDGTGHGTDGTIWGGEFLLINESGYERIAHLAPFPLPGGELAAREPRRCALGVLYTLFGKDMPHERLDFSPAELNLLLKALEKGVNAPLTSSMGRLFDAVTALVGLRQRCSFEGQGAMSLEFAQHGLNNDECYPFDITPVTRADGANQYTIEWKAMIAALLSETDANTIAAKFQNTLTAMIVRIAQVVGEPTIVLSGGCFQNRTLLQKTVNQLRQAGFNPFWQQMIPPNDGGIALGQIIAVLREVKHVSGGTGAVGQYSG